MILQGIGEYEQNMPFIDRLNRLEKLSIIDDAEKWLNLREIRNLVSHEYPDNEKEVIFIFDKENLVVKMSEVKTGISDFNNIEIISGGQEGDEIVSGPYLTISKKLEDEDKVKLEEKKEGKGKRGRKRGSND